MHITVSKWGNSLGIRIPSVIVETFGIKAGDALTYEFNDREMTIKKEMTTAQMFEEFYGKPISEIREEDLGPGGEMDWGADVGGEIIEG